MTTARSFSFFSSVGVALGGFLLFMVQPMLAKTLLPVFGGGASTWTVCMLFFQGMLLAGYAYVHVVSRRLPARTVSLLHLPLLAAAVLWNSAAPMAVESFDISAPEWPILARLLQTIGLPAFVLVTTSPVLQNWLEDLRADTRHHFALSNAGAFFALLSYPFLIDAVFDAGEQMRLWSMAFVIFALAFSVCAVIRLRAPSRPKLTREATGAGEYGLKSSLPVAAWAFIGCAIFMSASACANEAAPAVAFLWVLPLALYLLSFVAAFSGLRPDRNVWMPLALAAAAAVCFSIRENPAPVAMMIKVVALCAVTFAGCTLCHARMAASAGEESKRSWFYVTCAAGGFSAGVFITFLAPRLYPSNWELPVTITVLGTVLAWRNQVWPMKMRIASAALACVALGLWTYREAEYAPYNLWRERGFFGNLRILSLPDRTVMIHTGTTQSGQLKGEGMHNLPSCDFNAVTGIGLAMTQNRARRQNAPLKTGIVGMGAGMVLTYGHAGDQFDFFEINPSVIHAAKEYFTFLRETPARAQVYAGDGRQLLEKKVRAGESAYDVLIVDAFHGGAPPLHLLTKEAFALYLSALKPGGVLAIDADALSFDFSPLHRGYSAEFGIPVAWVQTHNCPDGQSWAVYTRDEEFWRQPRVTAQISSWPDRSRWQMVWTDSRHSLLSLFNAPWQGRFVKLYRHRPVRGYDLSSVSN